MTGKDTTIMLRLRDLTQLFDSMDPSPSLERDLDADAEEFIRNWARELPAEGELELVIQVAVPPDDDRRAGVEDAVRRYFSSRAAIKRMDFDELMRRARLSLLVGLVFLASCLTLASLAPLSAATAAADIVREGLTICGWVAMWRPLEIYLYDWWPVLEERRRLERLSRLRVSVVVSGQQPSRPHELAA